ncbi:DMT family transporter [Microbacterium sp. PRF11]|uniref:EamA family transporter n=1 Tax=Microbacterium sp. PRF11 TaxID=2962593 RepID=UPI0028811F99|nr:DMT family transporter [Microbacterium sp. PRF11]MDT0118217.1 DMT family transporter [Microbacterium sp. PRF11]
MTTSTVALPRPTHRASGAVTGLLIALASALAFSSSGPFVKPLLDGGWSLGAVLLVRMGTAALLLSPALILAVRRQRGFLRRHGLLIAAFGLTAVAGCQLFYFAAMQRMPVAVALLIQYIAPVLIVIAVWVRTRRAPSRAVLVGSVVAMLGLVLVVDISGARFDLLGTVFALCAAVCAAAYFVIAGRAGDDLPPLALAAGGLLTGTLLMAVLVVSGILPFAAPSITVTLVGLEVPGILPLLWVGAVATTLGYALGVIAVPRIGSRLASFVGLSEVLFALGFAWLLLGETPAPIQFVGGALILVGVVLVRLDAGSPTEQKTETASIPVVPAP